MADWHVDADVHEIKDHSLAAFTRQLAETRALLGDHLDVYHVHSATLDTGVLDDTELHAALAALRDTGVRVGVSTSGPEQGATIRKALGVAVGGFPLFTSIQATWNVLETSAGAALADAAAEGCSVIVKEAVANGRLTPAARRTTADPPGGGGGGRAGDRRGPAGHRRGAGPAVGAARCSPAPPRPTSWRATSPQRGTCSRPRRWTSWPSSPNHPRSTGRPAPDARGRERP